MDENYKQTEVKMACDSTEIGNIPRGYKLESVQLIEPTQHISYLSQFLA
jgi:hypothetical protein